jgi:hypothetical protein
MFACLQQFYSNGEDMFEIQEEERHLAEANRHIREAEERIRLQQERATKEEGQEGATETSRSLLSTMLDGLDVMKMHREQILARLADLNKLLHDKNPPRP